MLQGFLEAIKEFSFTQGLIWDIADMEDITGNNNKNDNDKLLPLLGFTLEKAIRLGLCSFPVLSSITTYVKITCSRLTIETVEKDVRYVES